MTKPAETARRPKRNPANPRRDNPVISKKSAPRKLLVFTVGHSTRLIEDFVALLQAHGVSRLIDVRTIPRSRTNPQFNKDVLPASLAPASITYAHLAELGGLRKPGADSPNGGWRNLSFRGYADYMQTSEFKRGLDLIIDWAGSDRLALMCAEAVPWRCHRSLIADALIIRNVCVEELVSRSRRQLHKITFFAKVRGTTITYPSYEDEAGITTPLSVARLDALPPLR